MAGGSGTDEWVWLKKAGICIKFKKVIVKPQSLKTTAWMAKVKDCYGPERLAPCWANTNKKLLKEDLKNGYLWPYRIVKVRIEEVK
jgi:hypothetical protein